MKKPTANEIIDTVTQVRTVNNILWMSLLRLAVTARPRKAKALIRKISRNDRAITEWLSRL
jgi:hypothetical protein